MKQTLIEACQGKQQITYTLGKRKFTYPLQNAYGSHIPLLLDVLAQAKVTSVLEFGCGDHSTPILAHFAKDLHIVEQGCVAEYDPQFVTAARAAYPKANIDIAIGKDLWRDVLFAEHYDLVFIDCYEYSRVDIANWIQNRCDIIILHDTEPAAVCYGWERLNIPWHRYDYTDFVPHSTVFSKQKLTF